MFSMWGGLRIAVLLRQRLIITILFFPGRRPEAGTFRMLLAFPKVVHFCAANYFIFTYTCKSVYHDLNVRRPGP